jgi:hypothetical protein
VRGSGRKVRVTPTPKNPKMIIRRRMTMEGMEGCGEVEGGGGVSV